MAFATGGQQAQADVAGPQHVPPPPPSLDALMPPEIAAKAGDIGVSKAGMGVLIYVRTES